MLVDDVDVAILQPFLYLESPEVQGVAVHSAECFPHAMSVVWAVPRVVAVDKHCGNHADVVCVRNVSELLLDDEHGLSPVLLSVERLESWISVSERMFPDVLVSGTVLVKQDNNATLSFASQSVSISTLHVVGDTVGRWITVVTDKRSPITLLTETLENTVDFWSYSHYVILYPGNFCMTITVTDNNSTGVFLAFFGAGVDCCVFNTTVSVGVILTCISILGFSVSDFICVGWVTV